jgi:hypothetical protein
MKSRCRAWWLSLDAESRRHFAYFAAGIAAYIATRLYHITLYPTYFFCDEANQAVHAHDLLKNGFSKYGTRFPTYFDQFGPFILGSTVYRSSA